jgi:tetratricopeptide (TPR) repeat protein
VCALAENAISQGDLSAARAHLQAASDLLGTSENKWLQALVCYFRGLLAHYEGDALSAMTLLDKAIVLAREGQFKPDLARALVTLGRVKQALGQVVPASELLLEGLDLFRALGHKLGIANALDELGVVSAVQGDSVQAALLLGAAHALREQIGAPLPPVDRAAHDSVVAACRAQLGEVAFAEAWAHAAAGPVHEVVEKVLFERPRLSPDTEGLQAAFQGIYPV